jgi:chromosome segregation ATPase
MNYINLKTSSLSNQPMVTTLDESDSEPLSSYRKRSSTNNVLAKPPSNNPQSSKDSTTNRILSKYPELKLNLKKALKDVDEVAPSKELTWKSRSSKPNSSKTSKGSKRSKGEPLTYRGSDEQEKAQPPRKTRSVDKLKDQPTQVDEEEYEKTREYENKFIFVAKNSEDLQIELDVLSIENKELKQVKDRFEVLEAEKKLKEDIEKYFHHVLKETNSRLNKENKKFIYLINSIENLKERYEVDIRRQQDQSELYSVKMIESEKEAEALRDELASLKSKATMIKLLEDEVKTLRGSLTAQEHRNNDLEKAMIKKESDFEIMLKEIDKESRKMREEIKRLEEQANDLRKEKTQFRMEKEALQHENNLLKARIINLEANDELVKQFSGQRENMMKEINFLRDANDKLKDTMNKAKRKDSVGSYEEAGNMLDTVEGLKRRIETINVQAVSCLQSVKSHLDLNFDLKSNLEEIENYLNLDTLDAYRLDTESDEAIEETTGDFEGELERNLTMVGTFSDNNKKLERCIYNERALDTDNSVLGKQKSFDFHSSAGSLKNSQSSSQLSKVRSDKSMDYKKPIYTPIKEDPIDHKLAEYINNHRESRKLLCLFKRRSAGQYMFGSKKVYLKLENNKLQVKAGQVQLAIEKFLTLNLDLEVDRVGNEGSRFKKSSVGK